MVSPSVPGLRFRQVSPSPGRGLRQDRRPGFFEALVSWAAYAPSAVNKHTSPVGRVPRAWWVG